MTEKHCSPIDGISVTMEIQGNNLEKVIIIFQHFKMKIQRKTNSKFQLQTTFVITNIWLLLMDMY